MGNTADPSRWSPDRNNLPFQGRAGKLSSLVDGVSGESDAGLQKGREFFGEKGSAEEDALAKLPGILARLFQQRPATPTLQGLPEGGSPQGLLQALAAQGQQQIGQGNSFSLLKGAKGNGGTLSALQQGQQNNPTLLKKSY